MSSTYYDTSYPPSLWAAAPSSVSGINPSTAAVGAAGFTLTVNGAGFTDDSVVAFEGDDRPTTFVSDSQLTATVAAMVPPARTAQVTVSTGGSSPFTVTSVAGTQEATSSPPQAPVVPQEATEPSQGTETAPEAPGGTGDPDVPASDSP